jgi:hypothetical protein
MGNETKQNDREPTPYAIICYEHSQVFLTLEEYSYQMSRPDSLWKCPLCGEVADWDDDNYELYLGEDE